MADNVVDMTEFRKRRGNGKAVNTIDDELAWVTSTLAEVNSYIGDLAEKMIQAQESLKELSAYHAGITIVKNERDGVPLELWDHSKDEEQIGDDDEDDNS